MTTKRPRGRPSKYTPAIAEEICARLSKGEPLTLICADERFPCDDTVRSWAEKDEAFSRDIRRAREAGFDAIATDCLEIADDDSRDWETVNCPTTGAVIGIKVDGEHVTRSKLKIETRLKLLAKWDPKRYGDKITTEVSGPDGGPVSIIERVIVKAPDPDS